jgi:hypothetical protein
MKKSIITCIILSIPLIALSQSTTLPVWNQELVRHSENCMWVLGSWGAANVLAGSIGWQQAKSPTQRAFHQMNVGWGLINLGLASWGLWDAAHTPTSGLDWWSSQQKLLKTQHIFLFNTGLDVGYVAAGFWMKERSKNVQNNAARWKGFGRSIVIQGTFLFVFDLGAFLYHQTLGQQLRQFLPLERMSLGTTSDGIGITFRF